MSQLLSPAVGIANGIMYWEALRAVVTVVLLLRHSLQIRSKNRRFNILIHSAKTYSRLF